MRCWYVQDVLPCHLVSDCNNINKTREKIENSLINNLMSIFSAQSMGLLSEPHCEEADHADPFYAHCKLHSDKTMLKHRKRNYNALQVRLELKTLEHETKRMEKDPSAEQQRVERKLKKHKKKYVANKAIKVEPWGKWHL